MQINLQHSHTATQNLTRIISKNKIVIVFIQESYTHLDKVAGFPKYMKIYAHENGRKRAVVIVNNSNNYAQRFK